MLNTRGGTALLQFAQDVSNVPAKSARILSDFLNNLQCKTIKWKTLLTQTERSCQISLAPSHVIFRSCVDACAFQTVDNRR